MNKKGDFAGTLITIAIFLLLVASMFFASLIVGEDIKSKDRCVSVANKAYEGNFTCIDRREEGGTVYDRECVCKENIPIEGGYEIGEEKVFKINKESEENE